LKCLDLSFYTYGWEVKLPETIDLPELANCCLRHVTFTFSDGKDYAMPFLKCKKLSTLVIDDCKVIEDDKILVISGDTLSGLTIMYQHLKVQISAPYVRSFSFKGNFEGYINHHQVFEHNMDFNEDASITVLWYLPNPKLVEILINMLKRMSNVRSLKLHWKSLEVLEISVLLCLIKSILLAFIIYFKYSLKIVWELTLNMCRVFLKSPIFPI